MSKVIDFLDWLICDSLLGFILGFLLLMGIVIGTALGVCYAVEDHSCYREGSRMGLPANYNFGSCYLKYNNRWMPDDQVIAIVSGAK